ncbi:hypothetical protein [Mycobacterium kyorinense]|nr:hypothetical protein [Mycobacterium kyorinense]
MLLIAVAVTVVCATCCGFPNRRNAADSIGRSIRAMPGVADADVHYDTSVDSGAHFDLTVTLTPTVTNDQGAAVAHAFVDQMATADFAHFDVSFELVYRHPGVTDLPGSSWTTSSRLTTRYAFDETVVVRPDRSAKAVAGAARWWLDIARSPAIETVTASLPLEDAYTSVVGPNLRVQIPVAADDVVLDNLIHLHPQLNSAAWIVAIPGRDQYTPPNSYQTIGLFLDRRLRQIWQNIVDQIRPIDSAEGSTVLPPKQGRTTTEATVGIAFDFGREHDFERIARGVVPLLAQLPNPVLFRLNAGVEAPPPRDVIDRNLTVTIGGCTPPDPQYTHPTEPLEAELRHQYEKC